MSKVMAIHFCWVMAISYSMVWPVFKWLDTAILYFMVWYGYGWIVMEYGLPIPITSLILFCWTYPYDLGLLVSFRATSVIWDLPVRFEGYQCDLRYTCAIWDILAKLHNHAINRKPHTGIWETCVIWPISNSEWQISLGPSQIALGFASGYLAETSGYLSLLVWYCQNNPRGKPLGLFCWNHLVDPKSFSASPRMIWDQQDDFRPNRTGFSNPLVWFTITLSNCSQISKNARHHYNIQK